MTPTGSSPTFVRIMHAGGRSVASTTWAVILSAFTVTIQFARPITRRRPRNRLGSRKALEVGANRAARDGLAARETVNATSNR